MVNFIACSFSTIAKITTSTYMCWNSNMSSPYCIYTYCSSLQQLHVNIDFEVNYKAHFWWLNVWTKLC